MYNIVVQDLACHACCTSRTLSFLSLFVAGQGGRYTSSLISVFLSVFGEQCVSLSKAAVTVSLEILQGKSHTVLTYLRVCVASDRKFSLVVGDVT